MQVVGRIKNFLHSSSDWEEILYLVLAGQQTWFNFVMDMHQQFLKFIIWVEKKCDPLGQRFLSTRKLRCVWIPGYTTSFLKLRTLWYSGFMIIMIPVLNVWSSAKFIPSWLMSSFMYKQNLDIIDKYAVR